MPTALSFLAHPDDAEFLCAGTLARLKRLGWEIHIATVAGGDCGTTTLSPDDCVQTRLLEAATAAAIIVASYHCLFEPDGLVVYDKPTLRKSIDLFRQVNPTLVFTHPPQDYMMDHEVVSQLARAASFISPAPNASAIPHQADAIVPHLYYCDPLDALDDPDSAPFTTLIDISSTIEVKKQMLSSHASQRNWLRDHHGVDEYLDSMLRHASARGARGKVAHAEAFNQHRGHAYPKDDLLAQLLGS